MTTIGTPLTPKALKVMMLGAGELGKEVVIELQRLGVEVIAVDRYETRLHSKWHTVLTPFPCWMAQHYAPLWKGTS